MSVFVILAAVWAWALVPPLVANRRHARLDPVLTFARFQSRDLPVRAPVPRPVDPRRRRQQVFAGLLTLDLLGAATFGLVQERWALAVTAAAVHVTVAWYAAVVRLRLRPRRAAAPMAEVLTLPAPSIVLLPAA
jgi:hypothetical protein